MTRLHLDADTLLATTRAVRTRLDLERAVERELVTECLELALQAPTGSNAQTWSFVVVTDPERRAALAELYAKAWSVYSTLPMNAGQLGDPGSERARTQERVVTSAQYLADHLHEVPVHVIPCITPRVDGMPGFGAASLLGSIIPAAWSFMLAARERGLGTCWTTLHLMHEEDAAEVLGIPYAEVAQVALIPVAHTIGTDFKPAPREPMDRVVHWNQW